ncbi:MAG: rane protein, partial [Phycisphaerales bacterium]|nr:rane protein [Phycisphaerales bacterium]
MTTTVPTDLPPPRPLLQQAIATPSGRTAVFAWPFLALLGLAVRGWLAAATWGTNDADTWVVFGHYVNRWGLFYTMQWEGNLNHPPLPVYWAVFCYRCTSSSGVWDVESFRPAWFPTLFKLPAVLADAGTCWLLYRIWRGRAGERTAAAVAAGYAWSLCAILVSGYHCNTDTVYAFFCLLAVYYVEDRKAWLAGGL